MMNSPDLSGLQPGQTGGSPNVRGMSQGFGNNPMSPTRAEAGCAGVSSNVPVPPSTPSSIKLLEKQQFRVFKMLVV